MSRPATLEAPSLLYAVKQVELLIRHHLDELLAPIGLTTVPFTALTVLDRRDGLTTAQLARWSFVTAQSMADVVAALQRRGLVERTPDPANRRRLLIRLTLAGRRVLTDHEAAVRTLQRRMVAGLDRGQVEALRQALDSCRAALTPDAD